MSSKPFASSADLDEKEQTLEVLADGVYALPARGDPNVGAIEGEDFLVCFEAMAPPAAARRWLARLREHTGKPVRYLVLSHYHAVRVLGASAFDAEVIVAHDNTRRLIAERGAQDWASEYGRMPRLFDDPDSIPGLTWPTATFSDRLTIHLGGDRGEPRLPRHDAPRGRRDPRTGRHAQGGFRRDARRARAWLWRLADLRALPAVQRVPAMGRAVRRRAAGHLDRRARPRGLGPAARLRKARSARGPGAHRGRRPRRPDHGAAAGPLGRPVHRVRGRAGTGSDRIQGDLLPTGRARHLRSDRLCRCDDR